MAATLLGVSSFFVFGDNAKRQWTSETDDQKRYCIDYRSLNYGQSTNGILIPSEISL